MTTKHRGTNIIHHLNTMATSLIQIIPPTLGQLKGAYNLINNPQPKPKLDCRRHALPSSSIIFLL